MRLELTSARASDQYNRVNDPSDTCVHLAHNNWLPTCSPPSSLIASLNVLSAMPTYTKKLNHFSVEKVKRSTWRCHLGAISPRRDPVRSAQIGATWATSRLHRRRIRERTCPTHRRPTKCSTWRRHCADVRPVSAGASVAAAPRTRRPKRPWRSSGRARTANRDPRAAKTARTTTNEESARTPTRIMDNPTWQPWRAALWSVSYSL